MAFTKDEISKVLSDKQELFTIEDSKERNGVLYFKVVGDKGTELTYRKETFQNQLDSSVIEWQDDTHFTIKRSNDFNLWD